MIKNDNEVRSFRFPLFFFFPRRKIRNSKEGTKAVSREKILSQGGRGGGRASQVRRVSGSS